jgi:putative addiction module component (TIGR02574 family)
MLAVEGGVLTMNTARLDYKDIPISERIQLVEDIWDSIAEETPLHLSQDERAELRRRLAAHQADPSSSIPWEQVRMACFTRS